MSTVLDSLVAGALADQKEREQAVPFEALKDRVAHDTYQPLDAKAYLRRDDQVPVIA